MNPVTAQMSPALLSIMSGPAPTNGVFQDLLDISVPLADTLPQLPVKGAAPATAPICAATIPLAVPPLAEVQNGAETDVLPQATAPETKRWTAAIILPQTTAPVAEKPATIIAVPETKVPEVQTRTTAIFMPQAPVPEINIEDGEPVAAEKPDASLSQIDPQFVPLSVVQTPPSVSAPVKAAAPPIAPPTTTPNLSEPAPIPAPTVQAAPPTPPPFYVPVTPATPLAPHARKLPNATEPPKSSDGTRVQWRPIAPQELVTQMDALPDARSDAVTTALRNAENKPQMPAPLPSLNLSMADDRLFSFEAPSGIQATPAPVTPIVAPTGTPIAELRQLIITADGEWVGALARDIVHHATRDNQLAFTLVPEHLGQLDIAVTTDNGKVDIRLETSTQAAAQAIATEQARLIEDLRHAGLKLGQFDMFNRQNGHGQQQGPQPDNQRTDNDSTPAQAKASSKAQGRFA
jgi:flagellar hook-length control protein FliK